jgi:hypothetical protein
MMSATEQTETLENPTIQMPSDGYETCEHCHAPVDANQRYCVECGTHRKHVYDPAARFHAQATSGSRAAARNAGRRAAPRQRSYGLGLALLLAAIPLAVAVGIMIGRPGDSVNGKLLAALRAQKPTVVNVGGGAQTGVAATSTTAATSAAIAAPARLTSNFGLQQGYAVELQTLPGSRTTQVSVAAAERRARAHGAPGVGLISQADFRVTPAPPAGAYVIYSGEYRTSAAASAARAKLKHAFPSARVISVRSASSAGATQVLSTTAYGSAHAVSEAKPTASQLASGAKVVNQVSKEMNNSYVKSQQGLPDAIPVP